MVKGLHSMLMLSLALVTMMTYGLQTPRPTQAATPGVYIALGDSIAAGIGSSLPRSRGNAAIVADWLARLTGETVPYENLAIPGETTATFISDGQLQRFRDSTARAQTAAIPIAAVTVALGGNELLGLQGTGLSDRQAGLDAFSIDYANAVSAVRDEIGPETPLVVLTYYDLTEGDPAIQFSDAWWVEQFNTVIRRVAAERGALVADVAVQFRNWIGDYTLYPFDIHPSNAGHLAIAQSIWGVLPFDEEPPTLTVTSNINITRTMPTVRFDVADNVNVRRVQVRTDSDNVILRGPYETGENAYALLLDLSAIDGEEVALTIEIGDDAGNVAVDVVTLQLDSMRGDESN